MLRHRTSNAGLVCVLWLALYAPLPAQSPAAAGGTGEATRLLKVDLPADAPVALVSADWGESRTAERGSALVLDLHTSLSLRNVGSQRIRALTMLVVSQDVTPGGRASVAKASLNIGTGETFPIRIDLRLLRPLARPAGPLVEIALDGVLFEDLSFYGPNRLDSRRTMTAWELEAQRDRRWFQQVLAEAGTEGLRREVLASLARQADRPRLEMEFARSGRATSVEADHPVQLAFLAVPGAPVEAVAGMARIAGNEARAPQVEVRSRAAKPVRYLEIGWLLRDVRGREYSAGSMPASLRLLPGTRERITQSAALRFGEPGGAPVSIDSLTAFVSMVEFADGGVWIPGRGAFEDPRLARALGPGGEEERLTSIYRKKGLAALLAELKKF